MRRDFLVNAGNARLHRAARLLARALRAAVFMLAGAVHAATFDVNSPADVLDAVPGDGKCETAVGNKVCTLRAAVQEANALAGTDVINLQANTTYLLTRVGSEVDASAGSLDVTDSVDIVGAGATSSVIDGNGALTNDRVFLVAPCIHYLTSCSLGQVVLHLTGIGIQHGTTTSNGGGIYAPQLFAQSSDVTLTHCRVEANTSASTGGGISSYVTMTLVETVVTGNTAVAGGGGAYFGGPTAITNSTFSDNVTGADADARGGGMFYGGWGRISGSTFSGNHAASGGGFYALVSDIEAFQLHVVNSTIVGNTADGDGGGLANGSGTTNLYNVTVAGNTSNVDRSGSDGLGGGAFAAAGTKLNLANSLIAGNVKYVSDSLFLVFNDCGGSLSSSGFNLVTHDTCTILGNTTHDAVAFAPLQDNGGPTKTLALLPGTGGVDGGNPSGCTDELGAILDTDQRGAPRPVGAACDLGAYEALPNIIFQDGFDA